MTEWDNGDKFWKRTSVVLRCLLALSVATNIALFVVMTLRSTAHRVELNAVRAQGERDREILTKMWQVTDDELNHKRQQAAKAQPFKK
jgi:hypothetical protein